jgi:hypothetical protein
MKIPSDQTILLFTIRFVATSACWTRSCEYLRKFLNKFETRIRDYLAAPGKIIHPEVKKHCLSQPKSLHVFLHVSFQGHLRQFARAEAASKEIALKIEDTFAYKHQVKDITPCHRVGRVLRFSPVVGIWTPPPPRQQASVPAPLWFWGRGTFAGERGGGRAPIPTRGHTLWYFIFICTLCSVL